MKNAIHWLKFALRLVFLLLFFPFIILWAYAKYMIYRFSLAKNLKRSGIPSKVAKKMSREMNPFSFIKKPAVNV